MVLFAALGLTATVRNSALVDRLISIQPFGALIVLLTEAVPYLLVVGSLTFLYGFIPNTRVPLRAAAVGGLFAGIAWQSASMAFATFVASANYGAVYAGFAVVIILLVWIYLGWLIVLFGCRLAFYIAHPRFLSGEVEPEPASRQAEYQAMRIAALVIGCFLRGEPAPAAEDLPRLLAGRVDLIESAVQLLIRAGLLALAQPGNRLLPARDPGSYTLAQLWLYCRGEAAELAGADALDRQVLELMQALEGRAAAGAEQSMRDWLQAPAQR
jgi:membrane protein